jgi:hypothetical protein
MKLKDLFENKDLKHNLRRLGIDSYKENSDGSVNIEGANNQIFNLSTDDFIILGVKMPKINIFSGTLFVRIIDANNRNIDWLPNKIIK